MHCVELFYAWTMYNAQTIHQILTIIQIWYLECAHEYKLEIVPILLWFSRLKQVFSPVMLQSRRCTADKPLSPSFSGRENFIIQGNETSNIQDVFQYYKAA